jgi:cell wall-associated NlpC family hydrolase
MLIKKSSLMVLLLIYLLSPLHADRADYFAIFIEATAKSKLGKSYKWGGNGPYSYDCSGFTKEVFELNGIEIPRNSWNQAKVGQKVDIKNLQKGDLVFFTSKHHTKVNHVGIYLGQGKFIHASRFHHRIVISPLREYRRYFKWGRRLA